jgi:hypothetical protein
MTSLKSGLVTKPNTGLRFSNRGAHKRRATQEWYATCDQPLAGLRHERRRSFG